jgi:hypothetical protein
MIHLMGVDHAQAQRKKRGLAPTDLQRHYQSLVESAIQSIHPDLLAEEDHPDYLAEDGAESILSAVAAAHGIEHLFVEADRATQKKIGYKNVDMLQSLLIRAGTPSKEVALAHKIAHQFPIRERYWLQQLGKTSARNILLIFGDMHFTTLTSLLAAQGLPCSVFAERVGIDPANDPEYEALKYAQDNNLFGQTDCFCLEN